MIRSASVLACVLVLAGCGSTPSNPSPATPVVSSSGAAVVSTGSLRPGSALIESISLSTDAVSASAGGTQPASGPYRITLRMDDGARQTIMVDSRAFLVGDRVRVLPDGRITRS